MCLSYWFCPSVRKFPCFEFSSEFSFLVIYFNTKADAATSSYIRQVINSQVHIRNILVVFNTSNKLLLLFKQTMFRKEIKIFFWIFVLDKCQFTCEFTTLNKNYKFSFIIFFLNKFQSKTRVTSDNYWSIKLHL